MVTQVLLNIAIRLFLRDWRSGEVVVLLMALVVGVASISAVTFFTDRVRQAVSQQAGEVLAADLRVESSYPLSTEYEAIALAHGVETAEVVHFRSVIFSGDSSTLTDVRGVSAGYPLRGEVRIADRLAGLPREASSIPAPGDAWAEPALLARLGLQTGDAVQVGRVELRVSQTLEFRPDEGWRFMELAPTLLLNLSDIYASGLIQPGSVVEYERLFAAPERNLEAFRQELEGLLGPEQELDDIRDARPEVRSSVQRAERFLVLSALVSVLLGAVAVAMAARRFMVRHLDNVALMKCVGARHRDIMFLILSQLFFIAVAAGVLGSILGFLAQLGLTLLLSDLIEAQLPVPTMNTVVLGPFIAMMITLGFAVPPLAQLRSVPAGRVLRRDLLPVPLSSFVAYGAPVAVVMVMLYWLFGDFEVTAYLLGGSALTIAVLYGSGWLLVNTLQRFRGAVGFAWRYGISNVVRRGRESSIQVVAFGIGIMALILLTVVRTQLMEDWQATLPTDAPNHFLINIQPAERDVVSSILSAGLIQVPNFTPLVRARISHINGIPLSEFDAKDDRARRELEDEINLTWAAELGPDNEVLAGEWWDRSDSFPQVSLEEGLLGEIGLDLGDELTFAIAGQLVKTKITSMRRVQWDSFRPNFFFIVNPGVLDTLPHTYVTSFYADEEQRGVMLDLVRALPSVSVIDVDAVITQVRQGMDRAALAVQYVFLFTFAAGLTVLGAAVQATRDERMYEGALLRTLGAQRGMILKGVAVEFASIGAIAGIVGSVGAGLIGYFLASEIFGLQYFPGPTLLVAGLVTGIVLVGVAGTLTARSVVNNTPISTFQRI